MTGPLPAIGTATSFAKTLGESDVYLFAGITGDLSPNHIDETTMADGPYGGRIAHGLLVLSMSGAASTAMQARSGRACVSYGYDRIRFTAGVRIGDTLRVHYQVERIDDESQRTWSTIRITNQHDELVMVATHILKFID
ncbi:MaoC family dehydratase [Propionibacteriaceae bacterium Y2011]